MDTAYSLSDIASVMNDGNGWSGNSAWLIILFVLIFGWGGNGFGNRTGEFSQFATSASQNEILLGQKFDALSRQINQVGDGLCSSTYALNNSIINEGRTLGTAVNTGFANIQNCCCDLKYDMATQFANANANTAAQTQKILDAISTNRIQDMQNQINALQLQNAVAGVVRYPMASTYTSGANPFCTSSCGCNI